MSRSQKTKTSAKAQRSGPAVRAPAARDRVRTASSVARAAFGNPRNVVGMNASDGNGARRGMFWGDRPTGPNDSAKTYRRDRNRVREQAVSNGLVKKAINVFVGNIVQDTGFDPYISQYPMLSKRWARWKKRECDPRGEFDWVGLLHQCATLLIRDGAGLIRKRERYDNIRTPRSGMPLQIQVMEIDQLCEFEKDGVLANGNRVVGGVERDQTDRPVGYWIYPRHPDDVQTNGGNSASADLNVPVWVGADQIIHFKMVGRPGESRPSPPLRTILGPMREMGAYLDNESLRKKITSEKVYAVTSPGTGDDGKVIREMFEAVDPNSEFYRDPNNPESWIVSQHGNATSIALPAGFSMKVMDVAPSQDFEPYVRVAMQHISAGANLPYPFLTEDYGTMNDRMYRALTLEFRRTIKFLQKSVMIAQICEPVFEWFTSWGYMENMLELKAGVSLLDVQEAEWSSPAPGYVNPVQEILAYEKAYDLGIMSKQRIITELGDDPMQIAVERSMGVALDGQLAANPQIEQLVKQMVDSRIAALLGSQAN